MITVIQRVSEASVSVDEIQIASIKKGFLVLVGIEKDDEIADLQASAKKITNMRIFSDENGKFNYALRDVNGEILAISQFTLPGDTSKGRRPSFHKAAPPEKAGPMFEKFVSILKETGIPVSTGKFGADMKVSLVNDGPVTLITDSKISRRGNPLKSVKSTVTNKSSESDAKEEVIIDENPANSAFPPISDFINLLTGYPRILLDLSYPKAPDFMELPAEYREAVSEHLHLLKDEVSAFKEKLDEIIVLPDPSASLQWFADTGILELFLPELAATVNFSNPDDKRHKHVWEHTKQVVKQAENNLLLRYAALFHDIGKVKTRKFTEDGKVTFYAHDIIGAKMFRKIASRLNLEKDFSKKIRKLIRWHLRPGQYVSSWTDSAVRRFYNEIDEDLLETLLNLGRADITSKRPGRREEAVQFINELEKRINSLKEEDAKVPPLPKGIGNAIMETASVKPGPVIGKIKSYLEKLVEEEKLAPYESSEYYISFLKSSESEFKDLFS